MSGNYFFEKRGREPAPEQQAAAPTKTRKSGRWKRRGLFLSFLLLMGVLAGVLIVTGREDLPLEKPFRPSRSPRPSIGIEEWDEKEELRTTVPKAPTGDGTTLTIVPLPQEEAHSFQRIYRERIDSIVSVQGESEEGLSSGTGVIFSEDGYLITNAHVIEGCFQVDVVLTDGRQVEARLVGMDRETDLAVLKIREKGLHPAVFGDSEGLRVGDTVLAIGDPLGREFHGTMTDGIVSAINRDVRVDSYTMTLIQTTAALNPGNSGGALLNSHGQVVGITNLKIQSYTDTVEGLGFAIPSTTVKRVADQLIANGHVLGRPVLGVTVSQHSRLEAQEMGYLQGLRVEEVQKGSDAWEKGICVGDWIVEANGIRTKTIDDLMQAKKDLKAGESVKITLCHEGEYRTVEVRLVEQYQLLEEG